MRAKLSFSLAACSLLLACSSNTTPSDTSMAGGVGGASSSGSAGQSSAGSPDSGGSAGIASAGAGGGSSSAGSVSISGGGSGVAGTPADDDALIMPEGVSVNPTPGGNGVFNVLALTLRQGPSGAELFAALENQGDTLGCSPAFSVEIFDKNDETLTLGVGGLLVHSFYRVTDGSDMIAACVAPGELSMVAVKSLPGDFALEDVSHVDYRLNYWNLEGEPLDGVSITDVQAVARDGGVAYTGTFANDFDVSMSSPSVAIFPVNRVGRPLGVALGSRTEELAPSGSWQFETDTISDAGVDQVAFPAGGP